MAFEFSLAWVGGVGLGFLLVAVLWCLIGGLPCQGETGVVLERAAPVFYCSALVACAKVGAVMFQITKWGSVHGEPAPISYPPRGLLSCPPPTASTSAL